eukprot:7868193-Lingulodinium_polyedra.AAC.1
MPHAEAWERRLTPRTRADPAPSPVGGLRPGGRHTHPGPCRPRGNVAAYWWRGQRRGWSTGIRACAPGSPRPQPGRDMAMAAQ